MKRYRDTINHLISHPIQHLAGWFWDLMFRRLLQNVGWLFSGNILATMLGLPETMIKARGLGVEKFGLLAVIIAYVTLIDQLASFRPWQALIKFGAESLKEERYADFIGQVKLSLLLDAIGAVSGTIIAEAGAYLLASWKGWSLETSSMAAVFSLSILFDFSGTPTGILRLLDRFKLQATQNVLTSLLALAGAIFVYLFGGGIWGFLIVMLITSIFGNLLLLVMAYMALRKRRLTGYWRAPIKEWKSFIRFSLWTYTSTTLDLPVKQLDIIIVSTVVSLEAAGIYKIIKQATQMLSLLADPVYQAIYPQFAAMIANYDKKGAVKYAIKIGTLLLTVTGIPAILLATTSFWWLGAVFGEGFASGAIPLSIFLLLKIISIAFVAIHPLFTAMGYVKYNTVILFFSDSAYLITAYLLGLRIGLIGLSIAYGFSLVIVVISKVAVIKNKGAIRER
jgi:O-antigen/teichoic acid export membrane protein